MMLLATPLRLASDMPTDAALVDAVARGDRRVAVALYDRLRTVMTRVVKRVAPRSADHADLVQQSFVELIVSLRERPTVRSLDAWAATVTARVVFHRLRREKLEHKFAAVRSAGAGALEEDGDVMSATPAPAADSHTLAAQRELLTKLAGVMDTLNPGRMQVFVLHDVHGYELKEIAEILGLTVANAQTRLVRGRKELHEAVASDEALSSALREVMP
ncbi:MAG: RNA polymerase sigma factor [Archangium sp.]|nr:RNA polymerase sigma factor [Archangium sp.]